MDHKNLLRVIPQFLGNIEFLSKPILDGHIHQGWYIHSHHSQYPEVVLQRVNTYVFKEPEKLMENIQLVSTYLHQHSPNQRQLTLIPTLSGKIYYREANGTIWRIYKQIENCYTTLIARDLTQIFEAGKVTGLFLKQLRDYPVESLHISIPDFHNTPKRYQNFLTALSHAEPDLIRIVQREIDFLEERSSHFGLFWNALLQQSLPWRVTHNDTKLDNVLFDRDTHKAVCLIDLDTIMPGSALFDFGDALRAMGNPSAEDEPDLKKVQFQIPVFKAYTQGYLAAAREILTSKELEWLAFSPWMITIEIGMRFLTDYLQGNQYFRIHYPEQNLNRCRTQFKLVADIEKQKSLLEEIVLKTINHLK
ncbi:MAG: aminoglycoside phosphotransferase family protein [Anaerolineaceae bacterium]|nr:aminoglycoside phosphotransferase family protein [Anaerolineaceae bacterium]